MLIALMLLQAATPEPPLERCRAVADEYLRRATIARNSLNPGKDRAKLERGWKLEGEQYWARLMLSQLKAIRPGPADVRAVRAMTQDALEARMRACDDAYGIKDE